MRKIILYVATSVDGFIAKTDGSVDWLEQIPNPDKYDYGFEDFQKSIDTTIQGYKSYKQIVDWGIDFPYKNTTNYVLTRKKSIEDTEYVNFIKNNHISFISDLKNQSKKDIWLIGGGKINSLLLNANLIDEVQQFVMPIVLSNGIKLFYRESINVDIISVDKKDYPTGVVRYKYKLI